LAFKKILDDVMGQQRKKELELYKLYAKDESFYQALFDTMKRMIDNPRIGQ
jgi:type I restriction enzyme R subunit